MQRRFPNSDSRDSLARWDAPLPSGRSLDTVDPAVVTAAIRRGRGAGVRVAVIDSGIEAGHPGLAGLTLEHDYAIALRGGQLRIEAGGGEDVFGHGTAVAGILRETAPDCRIGSFRILGPGSAGTQAPVIREAVRLALDLGYDILNCSFGCVARMDLLAGFKGWLDEAYLRDCHVVAAGSNEDAGIVEWPAHFPTVLSVTHVDGAARDAIFFRRRQMVQFGALGSEKDALWMMGQTREVMGSSFASPRVAGTLARLLSLYPETPVALAKEAMACYAAEWPTESATVVTPSEESWTPSDDRSMAPESMRLN